MFDQFVCWIQIVQHYIRVTWMWSCEHYHFKVLIRFDQTFTCIRPNIYPRLKFKNLHLRLHLWGKWLGELHRGFGLDRHNNAPVFRLNRKLMFFGLYFFFLADKLVLPWVIADQPAELSSQISSLKMSRTNARGNIVQTAHTFI